MAEVSIVAGIEKPPITHTNSFPVESKIQQFPLVSISSIVSVWILLFARHNNPFSLQRLPILGAFVYRHVECIHTETERVTLKRMGTRGPYVTKAAVLLKLLLFVSEGFYGTRNLSAIQTR